MQQQPIYLCATSRLARGMHLRAQIARTQQTVWQSASALTLSQWLTQTLEAALLTAEIPVEAMSGALLNGFSETHLWQEAIRTCLAKHEAAALFDINRLANTAMLAHQTLIEWQVDESAINQPFLSQETRQFLRWRHTFSDLCTQKNSLDASRYLAAQIRLVCDYKVTLPNQMIFAGFDRITPQLQTLLDRLKTCGVDVRFENEAILKKTTNLAEATQATSTKAMPGSSSLLCSPAKVTCVEMQDAETECRAAVAWAKKQLAENPLAQLAIISPCLSDDRALLTDLLDDTFHPDTLIASRYETPRIYDFSIGLPLHAYPIINTALQLLRLATSRQPCTFELITPILHDVYWGDRTELAERALCDAYLRQHLNASPSLSAMVQATEHFVAGCHGLNAKVDQNTDLPSGLNQSTSPSNTDAMPNYLQALQALLAFQTCYTDDKLAKKLPSEWLTLFLELLTSMHWAGISPSSHARALSSAEYQTQQRFLEAVQTLAREDFILGPMRASGGFAALQSVCQQAIFQPESVGDVHIQLLGLLETPALKLDAVWVMHMNDQYWPPPVKLNPLLPAHLQRDFYLPNASVEVQTHFANIVQARVNQMATHVVFSYAAKSHDAALRPSPMLASLPSDRFKQLGLETPIVRRLSEALATTADLELVEDFMAPGLTDTAAIRGGTQLFAHQAICPAWAFYQHRLGAKALETPTEGMDSKARGNLLHQALEAFWSSCKDSNTLKTWTETERAANVDTAILQAQSQLQVKLAARINSQVLRIEHARTKTLIMDFLAIEMQRADFVVEVCEKKVQHTIAGIPLNLTIDRIDRLATDASLDDTATAGIVVIDYKTGSQVSATRWAERRMKEPQLPMYATLVMQSADIAAVYFAKLNAQEIKMIGLAYTNGIVPGLTAFDRLKTNSPFIPFSSWHALLTHWQAALNDIGQEIRAGVASVTYQKDADLVYCEVLPLLRLPERLYQYEQMEFKHMQASSAPNGKFNVGNEKALR